MTRYLGLAAGPQCCLRSHLKRLQVETALNTLLDRGLEFTTDMAAIEIRGDKFRRPLSLTLRWPRDCAANITQ
ncbi:hypothetical protein [Novosphingobium sp. Gsoil 351]|uniref:hypothetical protein n=1 Tax=Novosphingobium sp. Gsoil 351 TaxID=2675225 RepID=UPI0012B4714A|nr:hypothetical protein [Novosphingobium sp. Gsoil 351]QGN55631.1 hypothetical protein GKE62_14845 [Novosphingobium sp. Gsoil 351]